MFWLPAETNVFFWMEQKVVGYKIHIVGHWHCCVGFLHSSLCHLSHQGWFMPRLCNCFTGGVNSNGYTSFLCLCSQGHRFLQRCHRSLNTRQLTTGRTEVLGHSGCLHHFYPCNSSYTISCILQNDAVKGEGHCLFQLFFTLDAKNMPIVKDTTIDNDINNDIKFQL